MKKILNFIGGEFCPSKEGQTLPNVNPATGSVYSEVPSSDASDAHAAIEKAKEAFGPWSKLPLLERIGHIKRLAALIKDRTEELARAESMDQGKPLAFARAMDIPRSARNFEFFSEMALSFGGEKFGHNQTSYSPLGVVAVISPWNFPLHLLTWKMAPALLMGNTVVAKPSELTPMTAYLLSELCREAHLPNGVINIVHGLGEKVGEALTGHPEIKAVSFTGSTATGRRISTKAAQDFKKVSLEMGGKNPNIIFSDCDLEKTLQTTMRSTFTNQGEVCTCSSRLYIERPLYETFKARLTQKAQELRVGDPEKQETEMGALISKGHLEKVLSYVDLARQEGGVILCGGEQLHLKGENAGGFFMAPTLVEGLPIDSRVNQEEIFGPFATLSPFDSEDEAIDLANTTEYGLSATIHTGDRARGERVAQKLETGMVWVNDWMNRDLRAPFGGVKNSGLGREGGAWGLQFFSRLKNTYQKNHEQKAKDAFSSPNAPPPLGAYPHSRASGNLLFLSGVGPRRRGERREREETEIPEGIEAQCRSVFENVRLILEESGSRWDQLLDVTVFLTHMERDFPTYNRIYEEYFSEIRPCRTTVEVGKLPSPISIELKCIATINQSSQ